MPKSNFNGIDIACCEPQYDDSSDKTSSDNISFWFSISPHPLSRHLRKISRADAARYPQPTKSLPRSRVYPSPACSFLFPCVPLTLSPMHVCTYPIFPHSSSLIAHPPDSNRPSTHGEPQLLAFNRCPYSHRWMTSSMFNSASRRWQQEEQPSIVSFSGLTSLSKVNLASAGQPDQLIQASKGNPCLHG